jgi:hypothetical protein
VAVPAAAPVFLLFKRRRIGSLLIVGGVLAVFAGSLLPLNSLPGNGVDQSMQLPKLPGTSALGLPLGPGSALALPTAGSSTLFDLVRHSIDHPLLTSGVGSIVIDIALRAGGLLIALAALGALACNVVPMMRGFAGLIAGFGLMGTALVAGVVIGEHMRTLNLCSGSACTVDLHAGIWVIGIGFLAVLAGSALGAMRPLAGVFSGISVAATGFGIGVGLAYLVASQHVLDVITQSTLALPRVITP